jgi:release factor glutamine methyltransferase
VTEPWADGRTLGSRTSLRDILVDAERRLQRAGVESPGVDAAELASYVLGIPRTRLFLSDAPTEEQRIRFEQLLARRLSRVPLQHITGLAAFRRIELHVGEGVFIPRPETELVAEAAIRHLMECTPGDRLAVDLCSGSGAIALSIATECPASQVHAVEMDDIAVQWTRRNADALSGQVSSVGSEVTIHHADAGRVATNGGALAALRGRVDVVVSNPPYIPDAMIPRDPEVRDHEPARALYGGRDGLDVVRDVVGASALLLAPGGLLVIEHADVQGADAGASGVPSVVAEFVADPSVSAVTGAPVGERMFTTVVDRLDLAGRPRFTLARRTLVS